MTKFVIEAGLEFHNEGQPFLVISRDGDKVITESIINRKREVVSARDLEIKFLNGTCIAIFKSDKLIKDSASVVEALNASDRSEFERRCAYVKRLVSLSAGEDFSGYIEQTLTEVSGDINDPCLPGKSSLYRWMSAWRKGGENFAALVPKNQKRGPQTLHMRKDVQLVLREVLNKYFLIRERPTLVSVMPEIESAIRDLNASYDPIDRVPVPSYATVRRFLKTLDAYEVKLKRHGKHAADQFFRYVGEGVKADAPLDLIEIDHTILDIQVLSPLKGIV